MKKHVSAVVQDARLGINFLAPEDRILFTFTVLHAGWEFDYTGWIVEIAKSGKRKIVLTTHGSPYFATKADLLKRQRTYKAAADDIQTALETLKGS